MEKSEFQYFIDRVTEEDSFFALTETSDDILSKLENQFRKEKVPERRAAIIRIIWERRSPKSFSILAQALSDRSDLVWKESLDGLITIDGKKAKKIIQSLISTSDQDKRAWLSEALDQIKE